MFFQIKFIFFFLIASSFLFNSAGCGFMCFATCQAAATFACSQTYFYFGPCYVAFHAACAVVLYNPTSYEACLEAATAECTATGPVYPLCYAAAEAACACIFLGK
uniref:Uncharacterized protein n=1 Tax=Meloidogyne enterolobii TaxID=390850 RepID=A0A6V7VH13_MELEN|nr:unnamed protein product [Meloidogyne enterolobii]